MKRYTDKTEIEKLLTAERDTHQKRFLTMKIGNGIYEGCKIKGSYRDAGDVRHYQTDLVVEPTLAEIEWVEVYS